MTSMLYEREETEREVTGGEVTELVWKLCLAHSASFEVSFYTQPPFPCKVLCGLGVLLHR